MQPEQLEVVVRSHAEGAAEGMEKCSLRNAQFCRQVIDEQRLSRIVTFDQPLGFEGQMLLCCTALHLRYVEHILHGIHYPIPLHLQPAYQYLGYDKGDFPKAEEAADAVLSLPLYPELTDTQIEYVVATLTEAVVHAVV